MSIIEAWALSITTSTVILGTSLGIHFLKHQYELPKWMSWPTAFLHRQIQRVVKRSRR